MITGVDISHWQPNFNFAQAKAQGMQFCIMKATEGTGGVDPSYQRNVANSKGVGLITGSYHFFHPEQSALVQAQNYRRVVGPWQPGSLPPVIDFEMHGNVGRGVQVDEALVFLHQIEIQVGRQPMIYLSPAFMNELGNPLVFGGYPLWIANYGVTHPHVPYPWKVWTMWQNSESARIGGEPQVDTDFFNGELTELQKFVGLV